MKKNSLFAAPRRRRCIIVICATQHHNAQKLRTLNASVAKKRCMNHGAKYFIRLTMCMKKLGRGLVSQLHI